MLISITSNSCGKNLPPEGSMQSKKKEAKRDKSLKSITFNVPNYFHCDFYGLIMKRLGCSIGFT